LTDYGTVVQGTKAAAETGLKVWDTAVTVAKSGNAMGEIMLGGHALGEALVLPITSPGKNNTYR
tara:strand:- start:72 stop:263 length:192 start_codon:yes stop_codon:yes gene_type:complete